MEQPSEKNDPNFHRGIFFLSAACAKKYFCQLKLRFLVAPGGSSWLSLATPGGSWLLGLGSETLARATH